VTPEKVHVLLTEGKGLEIDWADGHRSAWNFKWLRDACPCATCNDKRQQPADPFRLLTDAELQAGSPTPVAMPSRGAYAYQIVWNDGHDTGIYTLEYLRQLCERP
ncbi:MAG: DUF971 domain-containing protein, partial [Gemmataceae bacterium]